jgi:oligopeptide transport system permease protein
VTQYIIRRVFWVILVLFAASLITFALMHIAPGGPWDRESDKKPLPQRTIQRLTALSIMQGYQCGGANEPCIPP